jgi:hypothetical protein
MRMCEFEFLSALHRTKTMSVAREYAASRLNALPLNVPLIDFSYVRDDTIACEGLQTLR